MNIDIRSIVLYLNMQGKEKSQIKIEINNTFHQKIIGYSTVTKYIREDFFASHKTINENDHIHFEHLHFQKLIQKRLRIIHFSHPEQFLRSLVYRILTNKVQK